MDIASIESKIKALVGKCERLQSENKQLRTRCQTLEEKNVQVSQQVEQIVNRLKTLRGGEK